MKKQILLVFCLYFTIMIQATVSKTINLTAAGTLSTSLTTTELNTTTNLTVTGNMNACDFVTMRDNMPLLAVLDISNVTILAYTGTQGTSGKTSTAYSANVIPQNAFDNPTNYVGKKTLTNITTPNSATSIGGDAFASCTGLTSLTIGNSVTSIGISAFYGCTGLTSINIPLSVTSIGAGAFQGCTGLSSFNIPSSLISIGNIAFRGCTGLTSINIPSSVTSISTAAFSGCNANIIVDAANANYSSIDGVLFNKTKTVLLQCPISKIVSYVIPTSVTSFGDDAFEDCTGLISINIPSSVASIGSEVFSNCTGLTSINIPSSLTSIGSGAFLGCTALTSINIPSSVTSISNMTFCGCIGLTSLAIPNSVNSIGSNAFDGCSGLTSIYENSSLPINLSSSTNVFNNVNKTTCTLYVPIGSKSVYQVSNQWNDFTNIVETTTAIPTIKDASINLYPNPITESFQISGIVGTALMTMSDLNGKTILTKQVIGNENISVGTLPKGVYILKVITNEGTIERKVVKK